MFLWSCSILQAYCAIRLAVRLLWKRRDSAGCQIKGDREIMAKVGIGRAVFEERSSCLGKRFLIWVED